MKILRRLLMFALLVAFGWASYRFAGANANATQVDLVFTAWEAPQWLALLAAAGIGAALVGLWALYELTKVGLVARRYRKAVRGLESEVHQLRNLPLAGDAPAPAAAATGSERRSAAGPGA